MGVNNVVVERRAELTTVEVIRTIGRSGEIFELRRGIVGLPEFDAKLEVFGVDELRDIQNAISEMIEIIDQVR